ncbi:hypothetical protein NQ318_012144 [Aromia moschata]|uniref:Nucleolar protein 16 n=1 Tax=Aromia moschata TaxID=1265417 RepID=A0AAV8YZ66_9CUCU|nr:hypothetical protein NQ318_012144 [Aromia moschata]
MTKLRKQRRKKVYRHNINRKRLRNKIYKLGNIECKEIKNAWERKKSVVTNLKEMGLSYDPNKTIAIPSSRKIQAALLPTLDESDTEVVEDKPSSNKLHVVEALEADAKAPREKKFRLPKSQIEWITYLMKKYKKDYRAMARDSKNYNQETWKQIRQKIKRFKRIPEQYNKFLEENALQATDTEESDMSDGEL